MVATTRRTLSVRPWMDTELDLAPPVVTVVPQGFWGILL
jgi:hypothetical protein